MRAMINLIFYVLSIKLSFANLQPMELVEECEHSVSGDCSTYTITMGNKNCKLHIPEKCTYFDFDLSVDQHCDGSMFPKTCTFALKSIPPPNNTAVSSFLSVKRRRHQKLVKPDQTNEEAMTQWATVAMGKAMLYFDTPCKPETVGKPPARHMDCDLCIGIPPICNCDCRGWNQVGTLCFQPCHERGAYSFDSGLYCHKPCDQEGQNTNRVGCGLGHDRVCMKDSGACVSRHIMRAVDIASVVMNVIPGARAGFQGAKAAWTAAKASGKAAAWTAAKAAMRGAAREATRKFRDTPGIDHAFAYMKDKKDAILEEAAVRFMSANPPNDDTDWGLEIAKMADPTGIVSMVAGWIPPETCEPQVCAVDDCEALTGSKDIITKGSAGCTSSRKCGECEGDCDYDDDCQGELKCYQRTNSGQVVPGCSRSGMVTTSSGDYDYCYDTSSTTEILDKGPYWCTNSNKCGVCEGDCDSDDDCQSGLKCYQRENSGQIVPGCGQYGYAHTHGHHDYCYNPNTNPYEMVAGHIQCRGINNNLPGYLGRPMDFLNDVNDKCTTGDHTCVELGKRACEAIGSTCWGFGVHSGWGVQMYDSKASDPSICTGKYGLGGNSAWTVYIRPT